MALLSCPPWGFSVGHNLRWLRKAQVVFRLVYPACLDLGQRLASTSAHPAQMAICGPSADDGQMAMDYFESSSMTNMATIIVTLCALLHVAQFAPGYTFWMHNPTATIPIFEFAVTFKSVYPALYARLVAVGSCTGIECQHEIRDLTVELYRMFMGQIHPAFIQAIMLFIWCSPGSTSPQADLLNSMLGKYLQMPTYHLAAFRAGCGNMKAMVWSSRAAGSMFSAQQLLSTQGHNVMRLDPAMCPRNFYAQWVFLRTCAVEMMTRSRFESSPSHALMHIDVSLFTPRNP